MVSVMRTHTHTLFISEVPLHTHPHNAGPQTASVRDVLLIYEYSAIQSFKTDTRHKSMQWQKLKSKNICYSTKASNSDNHTYCKCISVPQEHPASNIRASSLQTEVQLHHITRDDIPQGKILIEEIPIMSL